MTTPFSPVPEGSMRVGLCQVFTEPWAVDANVERTVQALEKAGAAGANLAITPECVFHGYGFLPNKDDQYKRLLEVAEPLESPRIDRIRAIAAKHRMAIVVGLAQKDEKNRIFNTALFIDQKGELKFRYRKVHCREFESATWNGVFTPGDDFFVGQVEVNQSRFKIGVMICFDREITETVRCLRALGSHFIACPLATVTYPLTRFETKVDNEVITRCRASENEVFIAVVNHSGTQNGGTFIVGPRGEPLVQMGEGAETRIMDVEMNELFTTYQGNPLSWMGWAYRRQNIYSKYL